MAEGEAAAGRERSRRPATPEAPDTAGWFGRVRRLWREAGQAGGNATRSSIQLLRLWESQAWRLCANAGDDRGSGRGSAAACGTTVCITVAERERFGGDGTASA